MMKGELPWKVKNRPVLPQVLIKELKDKPIASHWPTLQSNHFVKHLEHLKEF
jgi:hypothetical protein